MSYKARYRNCGCMYITIARKSVVFILKTNKRVITKDNDKNHLYSCNAISSRIFVYCVASWRLGIAGQRKKRDLFYL